MNNDLIDQVLLNRQLHEASLEEVKAVLLNQLKSLLDDAERAGLEVSFCGDIVDFCDVEITIKEYIYV